MDSKLPTRSEAARRRKPLRVLIVRTGAMGDILHGLPAVAALRQAYPDVYIGWAVEPHWLPLLASPEGSPASPCMPLVDRIHRVPTREWKLRPFSVGTLRQIAQLRQELRAESYDVAVDFQGSIRSAFIGRMSGSKRFVGPRRPRERQARALYGERVEVRQTHVIGQACELLSAAVGLPQLAPVQPPLPRDRAAESWCDCLLAGMSSDFVLLAPGAGWGAKRWPMQRFAEVTRELLAAGHRVLINGSSGSVVSPDLLAAGAQAVPCSLAQLIALTRRVALVIGGDTGPVHLAAALGRPVVALFGPTDPARNGPDFPGSHTIVLRNSASAVDHRRHEQTESGLAQIAVSEVLSSAHRLLAGDRQKEAIHG